MSTPLLEVKDLCKRYPIYGPLGKLFPPKTHMNAVSGLSLQLYEGETYGLVGESGCGKTTTGRCILGLTHPDGGEIQYQGHDLTKLSDREFRPLRRDIQLVFQDPLSSLNPRQRIGSLLEEPLIIQGMEDADARRARVLAILEKVGLSEEHYFRYPHELSGGQVQRLGIARALIIEPKLIVCDEPVSALDVSIQAQILNMLTSLQREMGLTLLFISHDMGVVRYLSDRIGVMYLGSLVEEAPTDTLFANPLHPYTRALFSSIPDLSKRGRTHVSLGGELPVRTDEFQGCVFHTRCPHATDRCRREAPALREAEPGHKVACHQP
ncbi:oligopeptide ABC transporter ATP-binding protein OppF [Flavonifractor sp. An135]|nr:oligopeptide/dipeptide ABC transporter ATP-binding protein [Flavonifractor sp. An135]OUQ26309.1 oligopeptide ABC transporter ATP-binding protein OppF [Flavonifractor sp. An135]